MELSSSEKLILMMLCEVYEKLNIKGEIDPEFVKSAILTGNAWGLDWRYSGLVGSQDPEPSVVTEVVDILDMWSFIEESYDRLSDEDRVRVEIEAKPYGRDPRFPGFDGNNEADYVGVAQFLTTDLERFSRFEGRNMNSHSRSLDIHRRMYAAFEPIRGTLHGNLMDAGSLIKILKERVHPSRR